MGIALRSCCCCIFINNEDDYYYSSSSPQQQQQQQQQRQLPNNSTYTTYRIQQQQQSSLCDICGVQLDPTLLQGHRETCRVNKRKEIMQRDSELLSKVNINSCEVNDDELCVVCLDHLRACAFLPCGHVSCCNNCAKLLSECPLCRGPRQGLCIVSSETLLQFRCNHCGCIIAPELCDGHREVCALRVRKENKQREVENDNNNNNNDKRKKKEVESENSTINNDTNSESALEEVSKEVQVTSPTTAGVLVVSNNNNNNNPSSGGEVSSIGEKELKNIRQHCLSCHSEEAPLVIMLPCGHRVLCYNCAAGRTTCPVCLNETQSMVKTFL